MSKEKFNKRFGIYVAEKRKQMGITQSQLAALIGNNAQNVSRLERGEVSPTLYWLTLLAKALNLSLTQLVEEFESSN